MMSATTQQVTRTAAPGNARVLGSILRLALIVLSLCGGALLAADGAAAQGLCWDVRCNRHVPCGSNECAAPTPAPTYTRPRQTAPTYTQPRPTYQAPPPVRQVTPRRARPVRIQPPAEPKGPTEAERFRSSVERAKSARSAGNAAEAAGILGQLVMQHPTDVNALNELGMAQYELKLYASAVLNFRQSLRHAQSDANRRIARDNLISALDRFGLQLLDAGNFTVAIDTLKEALSLDPGNKEILNNLGFALMRAGRLAEALPYFEKAYAVADPADIENYEVVRRNLVVTLNDLAFRLQRTDPDQSLRRIERAYSLNQAAADPNPNVRRNYMALLTDYASRYVEKKETGLALGTFEKAFDMIKPGEEKEFEPLRKKYSAALIAQSVNAEEHVRKGLLRKAREVDPYLQQGEGLIGGMKWQFSAYALNLRPGLSEETRKKAQEALRKNLNLAGAPAGRYETVKNYDFLLGMAASSSVVGDFARVARDNLSRGRGTASVQREYDLLRGRSFDVLNCHSNGAMLCLAAIAAGDVDAKDVRLVGPEITQDALYEWNKLLKEGKIEKLRVVVNSGDLVPVISYNAGEFKLTDIPTLPFTLKTSGVDNIDEQIKKQVPGAEVTMFECAPPSTVTATFDRLFYCHDIERYQNYLPKSGVPPAQQ